jgi:hypothetical protein
MRKGNGAEESRDYNPYLRRREHTAFCLFLAPPHAESGHSPPLSSLYPFSLAMRRQKEYQEVVRTEGAMTPPGTEVKGK